MAVIQDFVKSRERGHMRWMAAGKNGGPRINSDMNGVFRITEEPEESAADGEREVTVQVRLPCVLLSVVSASSGSELSRLTAHVWGGADTQWMIETSEWNMDISEPYDDMFREWNLGAAPVVGDVVPEPPWWEKYGLPMQPSGGDARGNGGLPAVPLSHIARYEGGGVWRAVHRGNLWQAAEVAEAAGTGGRRGGG